MSVIFSCLPFIWWMSVSTLFNWGCFSSELNRLVTGYNGIMGISITCRITTHMYPYLYMYVSKYIRTCDFRVVHVWYTFTYKIYMYIMWTLKYTCMYHVESYWQGVSCMYVYINVYIHVPMYMYIRMLRVIMHIHVHVYTSTCSTCIHVHVHVCIYQVC